jgi:hypothetical protein
MRDADLLGRSFEVYLQDLADAAHEGAAYAREPWSAYDRHLRKRDVRWIDTGRRANP